MPDIFLLGVLTASLYDVEEALLIDSSSGEILDGQSEEVTIKYTTLAGLGRVIKAEVIMESIQMLLEKISTETELN